MWNSRQCLPLFLVMLMSLAACATTNDDSALATNHAIAGTQVAYVRLTASVQAARAETTLEYLSTRAVVAATHSRFLEATLITTGIPADTLATQRQVILGNSPTPQPTTLQTPDEVVDPTASASAIPTIPIATINAPNATRIPQIQATISQTGLFFGNIITATSEGTDGCGAGETTIFTSSSQAIYVIVPAFNIRANTHTFSAVWTRAGQSVGPVYTFSPDFDADELCVWFFVDQTDFDFMRGEYTVSIEVDGQAISSPVPFVIQ